MRTPGWRNRLEFDPTFGWISSRYVHNFYELVFVRVIASTRICHLLGLELVISSYLILLQFFFPIPDSHPPFFQSSLNYVAHSNFFFFFTFLTHDPVCRTCSSIRAWFLFGSSSHLIFSMDRVAKRSNLTMLHFPKIFYVCGFDQDPLL